MFDLVRLRKMIAEQGSDVVRQVAVYLEYLFFVLYFGFLWLTAGEDSPQVAQDIADLIFTQFFGQFVTVILALQFIGKQPPIVRWVVALVYGGIGLWIMLDLTGDWLVALIWVVSLIIGLLTNSENAFGNALAEGGWLMLAAFIAAFVGSMAGVPEESLLIDHIGTTAGWGILYYAGLLLVEYLLSYEPDDSTTQ